MLILQPFHIVIAALANVAAITKWLGPVVRFAQNCWEFFPWGRHGICECAQNSSMAFFACALFHFTLSEMSMCPSLPPPNNSYATGCNSTISQHCMTPKHRQTLWCLLITCIENVEWLNCSVMFLLGISKKKAKHNAASLLLSQMAPEISAVKNSPQDCLASRLWLIPFQHRLFFLLARIREAT